MARYFSCNQKRLLGKYSLVFLNRRLGTIPESDNKKEEICESRQTTNNSKDQPPSIPRNNLPFGDSSSQYDSKTYLYADTNDGNIE